MIIDSEGRYRIETSRGTKAIINVETVHGCLVVVFKMTGKVINVSDFRGVKVLERL